MTNNDAGNADPILVAVATSMATAVAEHEERCTASGVDFTCGQKMLFIAATAVVGRCMANLRLLGVSKDELDARGVNTLAQAMRSQLIEARSLVTDEDMIADANDLIREVDRLIGA